MAARHEEGCYDEHIFTYFLVCKGVLNDGVGVARGTEFQEMPPRADFETGDSAKEKQGGLP